MGKLLYSTSELDNAIQKVLNGYTDVSGVTATLEDVLLGKYFVNNLKLLQQGTLTIPQINLLQNKIIIPNILEQLVEADPGYTALLSVIVLAVTAAIDENIKPENIKEGITILGVLGTYSGPPQGYTVTVDSGYSYSAFHPESPGILTLNLESGEEINISCDMLQNEHYNNVVSIIFTSGGDNYGSLKYNMGTVLNGNLTANTLLNLTSDLTILSSDFSCLTGDTLITLYDGTNKRLDELSLQDEYLSYNFETGELVKDNALILDNYSTRKNKKTSEYYTECIFDNGIILKVVNRHRFFNCEQKDFIHITEGWNVGEHALMADGSRPALISLRKVYEEIEYFTVCTEKNRNGFANGLLYGDSEAKKYPIIEKDGIFIYDKNRN